MGHCIQVLGDSLKRVTDEGVYYFFVTEGLMPSKSGQGTLVEFVRYVVNSYFEDSQAWGKILEKARLSDQWRAGQANRHPPPTTSYSFTGLHLIILILKLSECPICPLLVLTPGFARP